MQPKTLKAEKLGFYLYRTSYGILKLMAAEGVRFI